MAEIPANAVVSISSQIPPFDISVTKKYEKAYKWTLTIDANFAPHWKRDVSLMQIDRTAFIKGTTKAAHKMRDVADQSTAYVAKFGIGNKLSRNGYFLTAIMQAIATQVGEKFNHELGTAKVTFAPQFVLELVERSHPHNTCLGEHFIEQEFKRVETTGDSDNIKLAQAFGHYSMIRSNYEILLADIESAGDLKFVAAQIHTLSGKGFGENRNLGRIALQKFTDTHTCNQYCTQLKLPALDTSHFSAPPSPVITQNKSATTLAPAQPGQGPPIANARKFFSTAEKNVAATSGSQVPTPQNYIEQQKAKAETAPKPISKTLYKPPLGKVSSSGSLIRDSPASPSITPSAVGSPPAKPSFAPVKLVRQNSDSQIIRPTQDIVALNPLPLESPRTEYWRTEKTETGRPVIPVLNEKPAAASPTIRRADDKPEKAAEPKVEPKAETKPAEVKPAEKTVEKPAEKPADKLMATAKAIQEKPIEIFVAPEPIAPVVNEILTLDPVELDWTATFRNSNTEEAETPFSFTDESDTVRMFESTGDDDDDDTGDYGDYEEEDDEDQPLPPVPLPDKAPHGGILKSPGSGKDKKKLRWLDLADFELKLIAAGKAKKGTGSDTDYLINAPAMPKPTEKWDLKTFRVAGEPKGVQVECITGSDKHLYTGSAEGQISIWDLEQTKVSTTFRAHTKGVKSLVLHSNGNTIYSGSGDSNIISWDLSTRKAINKASAKGEVHALCVSEEHGVIFSAENDKTIKVWDINTLQKISILTGHTRAVKTVCVVGNYLFSGSNDQQVFVWSLHNWKLVKALAGHEGWIRSITSIGDRLYTGSQDETVKVWDLGSTECIQTLTGKGPVQSLLATPQCLFSAAGDNVDIWEQNNLNGPPAHVLNNRSPVISMWRKEKQLFLGSLTNSLKVWTWD